MNRYYFIIFFLVTICTSSVGQQLAQSTFTESAKHYWNPAVTGADDYMRTSLFLRQQWVGFGSSAPRTGFISFQYPFKDLNMAAGAIVNFDQTGPVSKKGLQLTYAYKLKGILGDDSQFSIGMNAGFQQYAFDPSGEIFNDVDDQLLQGGTTSTLYPVISAGIYYMSTTQEYDENLVFVGLALRNAFTTDVLVNNSNQLREKHIHFNVGTRLYQQNTFIEPSLTLNYTTPEILDIRVGLRFEVEDSFWGGAGYSTISEVSIQGGVILPAFGDRFGTLRIGGVGNMGFSNNASDFGPGFELFVGYGYDIK